ncbi:MAG: hypothetical protein ACKOPI_06380, partial [bacterium]
MKRRTGKLIAAAVLLTALVAPASVYAAAETPNPSARTSVEPLTILKAGYDAFSKFKTCLKNIDAKQPCLASDSDNIRAILKEVRELSAKIEQHHKEVTARLQLLQRTLDTSVLDGYINDLRPEALNGRKALKAWERISVCMEQSVLKQKTCVGVNGRVKNIKGAVAGWKQELITQADLTSENVEVVGAHFTGTEDRSGENGLAFSAWLLNKRLQDEQAGVTSPAQLNAKTVPVVTRQLSASQNFFIDYYVDVLDTYGFIKPLAEALNGRPRIAQSLQRRVKEEIYGTGPYSVATVAKRMDLPRLLTGQILYRGAPDDKAWVVADFASANPYTPLQPSGVVKLANAMNSYGKSSALRASNPDSFPDHGWYSAVQRVAHPMVCPRTTTWCSVPKNLYPYEYQVTQLMRSGGVSRPVGVRPVDSKPSWNNAWYAKPYGAMGINFKTEFNHFVTGAAEFHWNVRS